MRILKNSVLISESVAKFIFVLFLLMACLPSFSQRVMTFQEMEKNGLKMDSLQRIYPNATRSDTFVGVFPAGKKGDQFNAAWLDYYTDLMNYFSENGLIWEKPTYCFNKIFFDSKGRVEYWFFNFSKADNIPDSIQQKYSDGLKKFSKKHKIRIKADSKFTQCASVTFVNAEDLKK